MLVCPIQATDFGFDADRGTILALVPPGRKSDTRSIGDGLPPGTFCRRGGVGRCRLRRSGRIVASGDRSVAGDSGLVSGAAMLRSESVEGTETTISGCVAAEGIVFVLVVMVYASVGKTGSVDSLLWG